ncbi:hypothetical protein E4K10_19710 [Streptomyces sp. T1317-0309]|nr:hypothetical protein E4K10_19710 [Streptomyces sp. T1317-0309]
MVKPCPRSVPRRDTPGHGKPPILGVPGPGSRLDRGHGRVRSRPRARHAVAIPIPAETQT